MVSLICAREDCDVQFESNRHKKYCSRECQHHAARASARAAHLTQFIAVDGEGQTIDGRHEYVMLTIGDAVLHDDGNPLKWQDIFSFLWDEYQENPNAAFVGFFLGYDFTQWLKGIPENRARMLITKQGKASRERKLSGANRVPFPVHIGDWSFDLLGMKRFKLKPRHAKNWMYVCDAGPFYQCSFVTAIDPSKWKGDPVCSQDEFDIIVAGKANRSTAEFGSEMMRYNELENVILARLMERLNEGFTKADIRLNKRQWMGPGQASQIWMSNVGCPTGEQIRDIVPEWARDAGRMTYYGGWFEIFAHGHVPGTTYGYDINSAYPFVISRLPCLLHGEWSQGAGKIPEDREYLMVHAMVKGSDTWCGSMLHRTEKGQIYRPHETGGWYWWSELEMARAAGLIDTVEVSEWVNYQPCDCPPPLGEIAELYQERLRVGKNSSAGKALKLVYNSAYGKLAQSVGSPKFSNPIWASLITSGCRTLILEAIATHPRKTEDLLMVATDGVYFRSQHPTIPISPEELGKWDEETKENLTLFMPGMYWDDKTRQSVKAGKTPVLRSRGVSGADLAKFLGKIDRQFERWEETAKWPKVDISIRFNMVSMGQALNRNKWELCGTVETDGVRTLDANPHTKRWEAMTANIYDGILKAKPYPGSGESTPYDRRFGDELRDLNEEDEILTPDGDAKQLMKDALLGFDVDPEVW